MLRKNAAVPFVFLAPKMIAYFLKCVSCDLFSARAAHFLLETLALKHGTK